MDGPPANRSYLREELRAALSNEDRTEDVFEVCRILTEALSLVSSPPILIGGAAVELYTGGAYRTGDQDFALSTSKEVIQVLSALDFERRGKSFVLPDPEPLSEWLDHPQVKAVLEKDPRSLRALYRLEEAASSPSEFADIEATLAEPLEELWRSGS